MSGLSHTRHLSSSLTVLLLLLSSSCAVTPNPNSIAPVAITASDVCSAGASLTNPATKTLLPGAVDPGAQRNPQTGGIGGTGQVAWRPGIGGTGQTELIARGDIGGIGGTGIVGVITGFASICVNGAEVQYNVSTPVFVDGTPSDVAELLVGQVVVVRVARSDDGDNGQLQAQSIAVQHAAVGPITGLNTSSGEFSVMGQTAVALKQHELDHLKLGDWVRISGYRRSNGLILASRVQALPAPRPHAQLRGPTTAIDGHTIQVGTTRVHVRKVPAGLEAGREIVAHGQWTGQYLEATEITMAPTRAELGAVQRVLLQGYVRELRDQELVLNGERLRYSKQTIVAKGDMDALKVDQFIQVQGHLDTSHRMMIDRLEFRGEPQQSEEDVQPSHDKPSKSPEERGNPHGAGSSRGNNAGGNGGPSGNGPTGR